MSVFVNNQHPASWIPDGRSNYKTPCKLNTRW